jgi:hypothetical protein
MGAQQNRQDMSLRLRADNAFWRTYDDTDSFGFIYDAMTDTFTTDYSGAHTLGPNWPQYYTGTGSGYCSTTTAASGLEMVRWYEAGTGAREVVNGPYKDFDTDTDDQVVEMVLGTLPEFTFLGGAYNDLWGRMGRDGSGNWDGNGIRARVGMRNLFPIVELSRFNNFVETVLISQFMFIPPLMGEKFTLVCGTSTTAPRTFRVLRNGAQILSHVEVGTNSHVGVSYRGVGFGMYTGQSLLLGQRSPAYVRKINAGDNATITQSGFVTRTNIGDQKMYDDYTFTGPGKVRIWNGPGASATDYVEFGPLLANQTAFIRTDPRDRNVYDLAAVSANPTQQERQIFDTALNGLLSFLTLSNANPILQVVQAVFGIFGGSGSAPVPPQGNFYSLLTGRFSDASAIPPKSPGNPAAPYHVKVEMVGGNADSRLIVSGVPLRRYPL